MRTPMQIEGVDRGPERQAQIGTTGTVTPAFLGTIASLAPTVAKAAKGAIEGVTKG